MLRGPTLNGLRILNGANTEQSFNCTYVVLADGRGKADCQVLNAGPESFAFVVFEHGQEAYLVGTTSGTTIHGNAVRQR